MDANTTSYAAAALAISYLLYSMWPEIRYHRAVRRHMRQWRRRRPKCN